MKIKKKRELEPRAGVEPRGRGRCVEEKMQDTTCSEQRRGEGAGTRTGTGKFVDVQEAVGIG